MILRKQNNVLSSRKKHTLKDEGSYIKVINKNKNSKTETSDKDSSTSSDDDIEQLKKQFNINKIINPKVNPTTITKNQYSRPTPLNLQYEERNLDN